MGATVVTDRTPWRRYGIGVDCHQSFYEVAVHIPVPATEEVRKYTATFSPRVGDLCATFAWIKRVLAEHNIHVPDGELVYCCEASSVYHYPLCRTWKNQPIIINPALACQFKARKTDVFDANQLAYQALTGLFAISHVPSEATELMRTLLRTRKRFVVEAGKYSCAIKQRLTQWHVPLGKGKGTSARLRTILEDWIRGDPAASRDGCFENAHLVPRRIWGLIDTLLEAHNTAAAEAKAIQDELKGMADKDLLARLMTAPGVGEVTALTWIAEVEPVSRFTTCKACVAYAGFDPTPRISAGKTVSKKCRKGNKLLRSTVVQAAPTALRQFACPLGQWGRKLDKPYSVKGCAVARKLLGRRPPRSRT
jgi:transposase